MVSSKWSTICTVGYQVSVIARRENPAAHGGVCHRQARIRAGRLEARDVNANGGHQEIGQTYDIDADQLRQWQRIEAAAR